MLRPAAVLLVLLPIAFARAAQSPLVGFWDKDGAPYAELRADGTGQSADGAFRWKADAKTVAFINPAGETLRVPYKLSGGKLLVTIDGRPAALTRGKKPKAAAAGKDSLSTLLLSSPWCHFTYNKISGASHQKRVVFRKDGTWGSGARSESYSSGAYGSVAGQTDSGNGGRWQVKGGRLLLSEGGGALQDAALSVSRNSNGYPILNAGGKEYSQCR